MFNLFMLFKKWSGQANILCNKILCNEDLSSPCKTVFYTTYCYFINVKYSLVLFNIFHKIVKHGLIQVTVDLVCFTASLDLRSTPLHLVEMG